jgi:hypothetical protein
VGFSGIAVEAPIAIKSVKVGAVVAANSLEVRRSLVTTDILSASSKNALIAAAADVLGIAVSAVSIVSETLHVSGDLSTVIVVLRFLVADSDFPELSGGVSDHDLFSAAAAKFTSSVSGSGFDTALAIQATVYDAEELSGAQFDSSVETAQPTYTAVDTTYDPMDAGLSEGEYAGAVIGVLVAFMLLIGGIYFVIYRRNEQQPSSGFASDTRTVVTTNQV